MSRFPLFSFVFIFCSTVYLISIKLSLNDLSLSVNFTDRKDKIETANECRKYFPLELSNNNNNTPIYDFIIFGEELDILEIRLFELYDHVTFFLIAESSLTFTGIEKPMHLKENWTKFAKYHNKIRRIEVELIRNISDPWQNEKLMRNLGLDLALKTVEDDLFILLTSDIDEIPVADVIESLRSCAFSQSFIPHVLKCDFYYYSYEYRSSVHPYWGTTVTLVEKNRKEKLSGYQIRVDRMQYQPVPRSCYHCSWCFNTIEAVRSKMRSYSHVEHNQLKFRDRNHILHRYRFGLDLFDRPGESYQLIHNNTRLPKLLQAQSERFIFMISRRNLTNLGFIDA